ncbi:MAG: hypothetical protein COC01_06195 [Bacteroidetes bacterium]|nr:MAG: hypothetical protein COC01_06195 [Bacteroidota bacterium]
MKELPNRYLLGIAVLLLLNSCSIYYAPNAHNVPLFKGKDDVRISIIASHGGYDYKGTEIQGAYAITDKIGLITNGFIAHAEDDNSPKSGEGSFLEIGAGYYKPLNKFFVFETYNGIGAGEVYNMYRDRSSSTVNFLKYFIQPSIGFSSKVFDAALSSRFCALHYYSIQSNSMENTGNLLGLKYDVPLLIEPALTLRLGWKNVKIQGQYGLSFILNNPEFDHDGLNLNVGLYIGI